MWMRNLLLPSLVDRAVARPERLVESLFDEFFADPFFAPVRAPGATRFSPAVDLSETDNEYLVRAELPGLEAKDISVEYLGDCLTLRGEKRNEVREEKEGVHRFESHYGAFSRTIRFDKPIDAAKIEAELKNGVLTVRLPKTEEARPRRIDVKAEAPAIAHQAGKTASGASQSPAQAPEMATAGATA